MDEFRTSKRLLGKEAKQAEINFIAMVFGMVLAVIFGGFHV